MSDALRVKFAEYEGPLVYEVGTSLCGFQDPVQLANIYATFGVERNPVEDYEMITGRPNVIILAKGLNYYLEVSADGYRQIMSNPGLEEGHILPFRQVS